MDASDFHQSKATGTLGDDRICGSGPAVRVRPSDFKVLLCLGCGAYGRVRLRRAPRKPVPAPDPCGPQVFQVRFKPTGRVYAMKVRARRGCAHGVPRPHAVATGPQVISKKHVRESNHVKYTIAERDVMTRVRANGCGLRRDNEQPPLPVRPPPQVQHPFVVALHFAFQSAKNVRPPPFPFPMSFRAVTQLGCSFTWSWSTAAAGSSFATWWTRAF